MQHAWEERKGTTIEEWAVLYEEIVQDKLEKGQERRAQLAYLNSIVNRRKDVQLVEVPKFHRIEVVPDNVFKFKHQTGE